MRNMNTRRRIHPDPWRFSAKEHIDLAALQFVRVTVALDAILRNLRRFETLTGLSTVRFRKRVRATKRKTITVALAIERKHGKQK